MSEERQLHLNESLKRDSKYLRGDLVADLADSSTGNITPYSKELMKFHGCYIQDDRDLRADRRKHLLERAFSFLIRVRLPGGVCTPEQWLKMDYVADTFANQTLKITTRQTFQLHGVIKTQLKRTIQEMNSVMVDTIAACGDVNRNVLCNSNPHLSKSHATILKLAQDLSNHLRPRGGAYHEIFLDGEKIITSEKTLEPLYGETYLPRKFKIAIAIPPDNDVDVYGNDLAFIAIIEDGELVGYNVAVGGGMGMTHGVEATYPRMADVIGFVKADQVIETAEKVMLVQRDFGDRVDRAHARFKYTIDDRSLEWVTQEINKRLNGFQMEAPRDYSFESNGDRFGWIEDENGNSHLNLFIQGGRVRDMPGFPMKTGLREIAKIHRGEYRLTTNQNLIIANISPEKRPQIEALLAEHKLLDSHQQSGLRLNSIACVALPTCGLALAEAERFLPQVLTELEETLEQCGLRHDDITIRMTGCPNGCARPYLAEIALVGKGPDKYNLYLGGGFVGDRMNKLYRESVSGGDIKKELKPIFEAYAKQRNDGERFGDFCIRVGYVAATVQGLDFHNNVTTEAVTVS